MRVLLIQPEDSPSRGPWAQESWDLVVDLGRSSPRTAEEWSEKMRCPILRVEDFTWNIEDVRRARDILATGDGRLRDCQEIDWWNVYSLEILREVAPVLVWERMAAEISPPVALWSTRPGSPASRFARILSSPLHSYGDDFSARWAKRILQYIRLLRHFSRAQLAEIFLDKYDAAYFWRAGLSPCPRPQSKPVVLIPSAYTNASRVAADYAKLLPEQAFLLVATRRSAKAFEAAENVTVRELGSYAEINPRHHELDQVLEKWSGLSREMEAQPELARLQQLGLFDQFPSFIANGLAIRDAWRRVFEHEPVCSVLCGDDSNVSTRIPVLLGARRGLPTLDFHHGAMDGFYLAKRFDCDFYLAKNDLERDYLLRVCRLAADRIVLGAPVAANSPARPHASARDFPTSKAAVVFFSEPYENVGMRTEEVYRELLPALCAVAGQMGRGVVLKLHPFESAPQRFDIMRRVLSADDCRLVTIATGPLSETLLARTWAGVTIESTTVLDCAAHGIPCFICEWLSFSPFGYVQQYAKFDAGHPLHSSDQIADIPRTIAEHSIREHSTQREGVRWRQIDSRMLAQLLGVESVEPVARPA